MPNDESADNRASNRTTPAPRAREVQITMNVNLPDSIDVNLDPLVISIPMPVEWFDPRFRSPT